MKRSDNYLTAERLREVLRYDPDTGVFTWLVRSRPQMGIGGIAGNRSKSGRRQICVDQRTYWASRLAFFYVTGVWPSGEVDHINGNPGDDAWGNLRDVTSAVNKENQRGPHKGNRTGFLGVTYFKNKFMAKICANKRQMYIGRFDTAEEAYAAYLAAKRALHEGCTI